MSAIQKFLENPNTGAKEAIVVGESGAHAISTERSNNETTNVNQMSSAEAGKQNQLDGSQSQQHKQKQQSESPTSHEQQGQRAPSLFSRVFSSKSKSKSPEKKFLDEFVVEEDGVKLPMVKFDSEGDFFKEPFEGKQKDNFPHLVQKLYSFIFN